MNIDTKLLIFSCCCVLGFFGMLGTLAITTADVKIETIHKIEMDNNTLEILEKLNGTISINYNSDYSQDILTLCKDSIREMQVNQNGEIIKDNTWEHIQLCNLTDN